MVFDFVEIVQAWFFGASILVRFFRSEAPSEVNFTEKSWPEMDPTAPKNQACKISAKSSTIHPCLQVNRTAFDAPWRLVLRYTGWCWPAYFIGHRLACTVKNTSYDHGQHANTTRYRLRKIALEISSADISISTRMTGFSLIVELKWK